MAEIIEEKDKVISSKEGDESEKYDEHEGKVGLKRQITLLGGIAMIVGTMIGSGIFASPVGVLRQTESVGMSLIIWLLCGLVATFGALCYAELGTIIPRSGGEFPYLNDTYGAAIAFLYSWVAILLIKPSSVSIIALTFAQYAVQPFFPDDDCEPPAAALKMMACVCVILIAFVNCISVKSASNVQVVFTAAKLLALVIIILTGFVKLGQGNTEYLDPKVSFQGSSSNVFAYGIAFYQGLWAYDGWNQLNYITEELINPYRNLPLGIIIGIPLVTIVYLLTNIAYFAVMSPDEMLTSSAVAVTFANRTLGPMAWIIPFFVCCSTFGAANGTLFTAARIAYVAGREGHTMQILSMVHTTFLTPQTSLIFTVWPSVVLLTNMGVFVTVNENVTNSDSTITWDTIWSLILVEQICMGKSVLSIAMLIPNDFDTLVNYFSFSSWIFYGLTSAAVVVLRIRRPERDWQRHVKVPIVLPIVVAIISIYLVIAPIVDVPELGYLYASIFILAGLFFYYPLVYKGYSPGFMDHVTLFFQNLMQVAPSFYTAPEEEEEEDENEQGEKEEDKLSEKDL